MLSYIFEFNLNISGEEAERYLTTILREWPALYAELPGVRGTLISAGAFALGGAHSYQCRVDIESFKTLGALDEAIKSDDPRWRKARAQWFQYRTDVQGRLLNHHSGDEDFCQKGRDDQAGQLLYLVRYGSSSGGRKKGRAYKELRAGLNEVWGDASGVRALQHFTAIIEPTGAARYEAWARLADVSVLDEISQASEASLGGLLSRLQVTGQLFGELREVDGHLLAGA